MSSSAKNPTQKSKDYRHFRDGSKPRTYKEDKKQGEPKKGLVKLQPWADCGVLQLLSSCDSGSLSQCDGGGGVCVWGE